MAKPYDWRNDWDWTDPDDGPASWDEYENVQQQERDLVAKLNEKYGPGSLDPQTGVFTPTTEVQPQAEAVSEEK